MRTWRFMSKVGGSMLARKPNAWFQSPAELLTYPLAMDAFLAGEGPYLIVKENGLQTGPIDMREDLKAFVNSHILSAIDAMEDEWPEGLKKAKHILQTHPADEYDQLDNLWRTATFIFDEEIEAEEPLPVLSLLSAATISVIPRAQQDTIVFLQTTMRNLIEAWVNAPESLDEDSSGPKDLENDLLELCEAKLNLWLGGSTPSTV